MNHTLKERQRNVLKFKMDDRLATRVKTRSFRCNEANGTRTNKQEETASTRRKSARPKSVSGRERRGEENRGGENARSVGAALGGRRA